MRSSHLLRILKVVGEPAGLNREGLRKDLVWAGTFYRTRLDLKPGAARQRRNRLEMIARTAERLRELLSNDDIKQLISRKYPLTAEDPRNAINRFIEAVESLRQPPPDQPSWAVEAANRLVVELGIDRTSAFDWLVGEHLPTIFEEHFHRRATTRCADGSPDTPYVRFARLVLAALSIKNKGRPYRSESIVRAVTGARKRRPRRRR